MKKLIAILIVLSLAISLFTACSNSNSSLEFSFEPKVFYTGFQNLQQDYSIEDAEKDGCVVIQQFKIVANQKAWDKFVKVAKRGDNTNIRLVSSTTYVNGLSVIDLFYNDGAYYSFHRSSEALEKQPFEYLVELDGQDGDPIKDYKLFVLTDNKELTFDDTFIKIAKGSLDSYGIGLVMFLKD